MPGRLPPLRRSQSRDRRHRASYGDWAIACRRSSRESLLSGMRTMEPSSLRSTACSSSTLINSASIRNFPLASVQVRSLPLLSVGALTGAFEPEKEVLVVGGSDVGGVVGALCGGVALGAAGENPAVAWPGALESGVGDIGSEFGFGESAVGGLGDAVLAVSANLGRDLARAARMAGGRVCRTCSRAYHSPPDGLAPIKRTRTCPSATSVATPIRQISSVHTCNRSSA